MSTNNQDSNRLSDEQKQKMKKYAVFALMGIICAGCMWFIFAPSADEKARQEAQAGFNSDIPLPKNEALVNDKRTAYEQEQMQQKKEEKMRSLQDFSALLGDDAKPNDDLALLTDEPAKEKPSGGSRGGSSRPKSSIENSARTYQDVNRTLGNFYEKPKEDPEKELLKQEMEELKARLDEQDNKKNTTDEQLALMEKSFQMAAKYMPSGAAGTLPVAGTANADVSTEPANGKNNSAHGMTFVPVSKANERVVSSLQPEMSDAEFLETYSRPRNMGFVTATAVTGSKTRNTIAACIHANQTVLDGQSVRLRLLEPIVTGGMYVQRNVLVSGTAKIQGERLQITVNSLENDGTILPIELSVFDLDGQRGIFIPNMQELSAAKEVVANMGTNAGTSINLSNDAKQQFIADMGRNVLQGVSQFASKKLREVKVHLKSGYKVYLISETQLKNTQVLANK